VLRINPGDRALPFVELGDSDEIHLGDSVRVLGFPAEGGKTVTFTDGKVSGFDPEERVGDRAWIKTNAIVAGGSSGGLAINEQGQIIGIPTFVVDSLGGAINRLRAINLAKPMIKAVKAGQDYDSPYKMPDEGNEKFTLKAWAERHDKEGCPVNTVDRYPSGVLGIDAVFSYEGMKNGQVFHLAFFYGDLPIGEEMWLWYQGASGRCRPFFYYEASHDPLFDGDYKVVLEAGADLHPVGKAEVSVGEESVKGSVKVEGYITDADTGKGIPGAALIVLKPGTDIGAWLKNHNGGDVYTLAQTDKKGFYQLPARLKPGVIYPAVAGAEGYSPASGNIKIPPRAPDPYRLDIKLTE
jgi:hypothetical protein